MKRNKLFLCAALMLAVSCTDDSDNRLPDGKYPMTFTAVVDGMTATRVTTDNTWVGDEKVAIQIGGDVKKYTVASGGSMTVETGDTPFCWTNSDQTMNVSAWHTSTYAATKPEKFSIETDQSGTDYQASDFLYTSQQVTYGNGSGCSLVFKHLPAKVVVNLKYGDGVTEQEVSSATVSLVNQATTSGKIADDGTVAQATPGNATIAPPNVLSSATSGYQKSVQALLVPQQMKGKQFIKVSVTTDDIERIYYYTPTGTDNANLAAGQQYTYNLTVKKEGLQVEQVSASWNESSLTGNLSENITYQITAPTAGVAITTTASGASLSGGNGFFTLSGGNEITVTVDANSQSNKLLKDLPIKGLYDITSAGHTSDNYTYTYTLKSDMSISAPEFVDKGTLAVGDYYYLDGTWSAELWDKPCSGIVFKVGAGTDDNLNNYSGSGLTGQINGYAVALTATTTETDDDRRVWGNIGNVTLNTDNDKFYGYSNTKTIREASGYNETNYWACYSAVNYAVVVPSCSSGWYLPSLGEYNALWQVYGTIENKLTSADGTVMKRSWGLYWTSSKNNNGAACVDFGAWSSTGSFARAVRTDNSFVRPVLTF